MTRDGLPFASLTNGAAASLDSIPRFGAGALAKELREGIGLGLRLSAYFGSPPSADADKGEAAELFALLADDERNRLYAGRAPIGSEGFPSIADDCPQAQLFEREIAEQFGVPPLGHPWLKSLRYPRTGAAGVPEPGVADFYRVDGEQIHEVAVGPVHAGVIEPGHFRFQCHGERVLHLEIALGYQHRGIERALAGGPDKRSIHYAETAAGDTTIGHAMAYCQVLDGLARRQRPARAQAMAAIALELERLANHVGDLGALSGDVGFLPTASYCGRIRGDFLNMTALLCGNRFGRGLIRPGGLAYDADEGRVAELSRRLAEAEKATGIAIRLLFDTQSVQARFEDTGRLSRETAAGLGLVGPAARASGLSRDLRCDQPSGIYRLAQIPVSTYDSGDVLGRAFVRWLEIQRSLDFVREQLASLPRGPVAIEAETAGGGLPHGGGLAPRALVAALEEGWRGEICHVAITDEAGAFARYKIVDPSFHNWPGLAYAMRDQDISDFPLCNKSFNLSYCGHDL